MEPNPFLLPTEEYQRDLKPISDYKKQAAFYLSSVNDISYEEAYRFIEDNMLPGGLFPINNPKVTYIGKNKYGDRELREGTLSEYIGSSIAEDEIIAPTFTTYLPTKAKESFYAKYTSRNKKRRSAVKKEMLQAKLSGDHETAEIKKYVQNNLKIKNNTPSGSSSVPNTPIYNPTMHNTLTSICRITASYGNTNIERFLAGNRHYHQLNLILYNISSICCNTDYDSLLRIMKKYKLHYPSPKETYDVVMRSASMYLDGSKVCQVVYEYITHLTDLQRAAYVYTGDFYHLRIFNESFVRNMLNEFCQDVSIIPSINVKEVIDTHEEALYQLAAKIRKDITKGQSVYDRHFIESDHGKLLASHVVHIQSVIMKYADLFIAFYRTKNIPANVSDFKDSIRLSVLNGDTDSNIFTTEEWIRWYFGDITFEDKANAIFAILVYMVRYSLAHILAVMSANLGVDSKNMYVINMKDEFKFEVYVCTDNTKHYFASITQQEANIYTDPVMEIKGVHLITSTSPKHIIDDAAEMMRSICKDVSTHGKVSCLKYMKHVARLEYSLMDDIMNGGTKYYKTSNIKPKEAYALEESVYRYHVLWNEVFAPSYGSSPPLPYQAYKLNLRDAGTSKKTLALIESIEDTDIRNRLLNFFNDSTFNYLNTIYVPVDTVKTSGIPKELVSMVDHRSIISEVLTPHYEVMTSLGIYRKNQHITRLFSDELPR